MTYIVLSQISHTMRNRTEEIESRGDVVHGQWKTRNLYPATCLYSPLWSWKRWSDASSWIIDVNAPSERSLATCFIEKPASFFELRRPVPRHASQPVEIIVTMVRTLFLSGLFSRGTGDNARWPGQFSSVGESSIARYSSSNKFLSWSYYNLKFYIYEDGAHSMKQLIDIITCFYDRICSKFMRLSRRQSNFVVLFEWSASYFEIYRYSSTLIAAQLFPLGSYRSSRTAKSVAPKRGKHRRLIIVNGFRGKSASSGKNTTVYRLKHMIDNESRQFSRGFGVSRYCLPCYYFCNFDEILLSLFAVTTC